MLPIFPGDSDCGFQGTCLCPRRVLCIWTVSNFKSQSRVIPATAKDEAGSSHLWSPERNEMRVLHPMLISEVDNNNNACVCLQGLARGVWFGFSWCVRGLYSSAQDSSHLSDSLCLILSRLVVWAGVVKLGPHSQQCCCLLCTTGRCSRAWGLIRENQSHIPLPRTLHHAVAQNRWWSL